MSDQPDSLASSPRPEDSRFRFENFWKKVDKNGPIPERYPELGPCWIWKGKLRSNGYGVAWNMVTQKEFRAHRAAYFMEVGHTDFDLCHKCDNPACIRPSHLFPGTIKQNLADMRSKGRGFQKLTTAEAIEILNLRSTGMTLDGIHQRFKTKVTMSAIQHICYRRVWKHLNVDVVVTPQ